VSRQDAEINCNLADLSIERFRWGTNPDRTSAEEDRDFVRPMANLTAVAFARIPGVTRNRNKSFCGERRMPEHVYKVVELVGSSEESVTKAIDRAISKAALTIRHLGWFEVAQVRGHIENGKVAQYQVTIKAGFRLEDE
jgi:flavin-binding protein dodecin